MHLYLNYAKKHWVKSDENPPIGLILCALKGEGEAHYALEGLPNQVIAAEYQTLLPNEKQLVEALKHTQEMLKTRRIVTGSTLKGRGGVVCHQNEVVLRLGDKI